MSGALAIVAFEIFNGQSLIWSFEIECRTVHSCWLHRIKLYASLPAVSRGRTCLGWQRRPWMHWSYISKRKLFNLVGPVLLYRVCAVRLIWYPRYMQIPLWRNSFVSIMSNHLHPFISIVYSVWFGQFEEDIVTSQSSRVARVAPGKPFGD